MQRPNMDLTKKKRDKSNWSLIFERPKNVKERGEWEKKKKRKRMRRRRKEKEKGRVKGMELCIYLYGYKFVGCSL